MRRVRVESDDNVHFAAQIVSARFAGLRPIARHQLVYKTLGALMGREIHALVHRGAYPGRVRQRLQ